MLGGWVGHLLDETVVRDPALRMGSRTDHLYDLWDELSHTEQDGTFDIPEVWGHLPHETNRGDRLTLDVICRWTNNMLVGHLPEATAVPLKGYAQVLARLTNAEYPRPLIVGTPLYVQYSTLPETLLAPAKVEDAPPAVMQRSWWRRALGY
jgi:hypothetical protein